MNEIQYKKEVEFGLTREQWFKMWEEAGWRESVVKACLEVAACPHATPMDREFALGIWGTLITCGLTPDKTPDGETSFAEVFRDTQLAVVTGAGRPAEIDEEARLACNERLAGVKWTMDTIAKFIDVGTLLRGAMSKVLGEVPPVANMN